MTQYDPFPDHQHRAVNYPCGCTWEDYSSDGAKWVGWRGYLCAHHANEFSEWGSSQEQVVFLKKDEGPLVRRRSDG